MELSVLLLPTSFVPSAEEVRYNNHKPAVFGLSFHVRPEFVEVWMEPVLFKSLPTSFVPSAEEVRYANHKPAVFGLSFHVRPESVEV